MGAMLLREDIELELARTRLILAALPAHPCFAVDRELLTRPPASSFGIGYWSSASTAIGALTHATVRSSCRACNGERLRSSDERWRTVLTRVPCPVWSLSTTPWSAERLPWRKWPPECVLVPEITGSSTTNCQPERRRTRTSYSINGDLHVGNQDPHIATCHRAGVQLHLVWPDPAAPRLSPGRRANAVEVMNLRQAYGRASPTGDPLDWSGAV